MTVGADFAERAYAEWLAKRDAFKEHLRTFEGLVLDADGVLFDGRETRAQGIHVMKTRDLRDGQGISFLRAMGIRILFATGEGEPLGSIVAKLNGLPSCVSGATHPVELLTELKRGKEVAVFEWMQRHSIRGVTYVGDDRTDCEAMKLVREQGGAVVLPFDHQRVVKKYASHVLQRSGGAGALREFAEMVCDARGIDEETLPIA